MPRIRHALQLFIAASLATLGCSEADPSKTGDENDLKELETIEGPEVVRCSVALDTSTADPFFRTDMLACEYHAPTSFPLSTMVAMVEVSASGNRFLKSARFPNDAPASGEPLELTGVHADMYPLSVQVRLLIEWDESIRDIPHVGEIGTTFTIAAPGGDPISAAIPFDLWPVDVLARKAPFVGRFDYALDLAPFARTDGATTLPVQTTLWPLGLGQTHSYLVPVTHGAPKVAGAAFFDPSIDSYEQAVTAGKTPIQFELAGPGTYVAEPEGLHGRTETDAAAESDGPTIASCWLDPGAEAAKHDVRCQLAPVEGVQIAGGSAVVTDASGAALPETALAGSDVVTVASIDDASLPATIAVRVTLAGTAVGLRPNLLAKPIEATLDVAKADALTSAAPGLVKLPFDLWPISIQASADTGFFGILDPYLVVMNSTWNGLSTLSVSNEATPFVSQGASQTFYVVADSHMASMAGKAVLMNSSGSVKDGVPFTFERGASYVVTSEGLTKAGQ